MVGRTAVTGLLVLSLGLGACGRLGFGSGDQYADAPRRPDALPASPTTPVSQTTLQPMLPPVPGEPPPVDQTAPPPGAAPVTTAAVPPTADPAAAAPTPQPSVAIGRTDVIGGWEIVSTGERCGFTATTTSWTGGMRGSTQRCTSPTLQKVSAWTLEGGEVVLRGADGSQLATLSATSKTRFDGRTADGRPITLTRPL